MAEPPERGTFTTQWLPRGTIPALVPDFLAKPGKKLLGRKDAGLGSLGGCSITGSSLAGSSLAGSSLGGWGPDGEWISEMDLEEQEAERAAAASGKPMTNVELVKTLDSMVPKPPPKRTGMTRDQKIAVAAGLGVVAYLLLKKKR
jgi:hypothetical protein